ncbi:Hypothetical predicted protein [Marmota monax]|uniref:Uncharacterized protein n=1 Tax=Marmota monax TaxID=9995 RepID=A0A5E4ABN2_MARMO|nr:Hypothetical predicted protein [Marmota monax]
MPALALLGTVPQDPSLSTGSLESHVLGRLLWQKNMGLSGRGAPGSHSDRPQAPSVGPSLSPRGPSVTGRDGPSWALWAPAQRFPCLVPVPPCVPGPVWLRPSEV